MMLPNPSYPLYMRYPTQRDNFLGVSVVSGAFVVPIEGSRRAIVGGQFNAWRDNNCCGSMGFSALKTFYRHLNPSTWDGPDAAQFSIGANNEHRSPVRPHPFSFNALSNPETSVLLHPAHLDKDFGEFSDFDEAIYWMQGVLCANILGLMEMWNRNLGRAVDVEGGNMTHVLRRMPAIAPLSCVVSPIGVDYGYDSGAPVVPTRGSYYLTPPHYCQPNMNGVNYSPSVYNRNSGARIRSIDIYRAAPVGGIVTTDEGRQAARPVRSYANSFSAAVCTRARHVMNSCTTAGKPNYSWACFNNYVHY